MAKVYSKEFNFFPKSWLLPHDYNEVKEYLTNNRKSTIILKPAGNCQGRGIYLVNKVSEIPVGEKYVVQEYIHKPFLIDNLKFDFRIYVIITGVNPLRIFIYEEGLARFATEIYEEPNNENIDDDYMHLTNYAINKRSENFVKNKDED